MKLTELLLKQYARTRFFKRLYFRIWQSNGTSYSKLSKKEIRTYHKYSIMAGFDIFAYFIKQSIEGGKCQLKIPDRQAAKHALTVLVLKESAFKE